MEQLTKKCPGCKTFLPLSAYYRSRSTRLGVQTYCKPCHRIKVVACHARNPENRRNGVLKERYGINLVTWKQMLADQGGLCAICGVDDPGQKYWHTDHCHTTGKVRGLLCSRCNTALGHLENIPWRELADAYLAAHSY